MNSTTFDGLVVVAILVPVNSSYSGSLDPLSTTNTSLTERNAFASLGYSMIATTNSSGIATFTMLNVLDIGGETGCFKFKFAIGEPTQYLVTSETNISICFKTNYAISMNPEYSTNIAPYQKFYSPINLTVRLIENNTIIDGDILAFSIYSKGVGKYAVASNTNTLATLANNVCIILRG